MIDGQPEGRLQLELADRVVLTKMDLASPELIEGLRVALAAYPGLEVQDAERAFEMTGGSSIAAAPHRQTSPHDAETSIIELDSPVDSEWLARERGLVALIYSVVWISNYRGPSPFQSVPAQ